MAKYVIDPEVALRLAQEKGVLQQVAWSIADQLGRPGTFDAEYIALTKLQADALVALNKDIIDAAVGLVPLVPYEALQRP